MQIPGIHNQVEIIYKEHLFSTFCSEIIIDSQEVAKIAQGGLCPYYSASHNGNIVYKATLCYQDLTLAQHDELDYGSQQTPSVFAYIVIFKFTNNCRGQRNHWYRMIYNAIMKSMQCNFDRQFMSVQTLLYYEQYFFVIVSIAMRCYLHHFICRYLQGLHRSLFPVL